jgi:hypothetical protein
MCFQLWQLMQQGWGLKSLDLSQSRVPFWLNSDSSPEAQDSDVTRVPQHVNLDLGPVGLGLDLDLRSATHADLLKQI